MRNLQKYGSVNQEINFLVRHLMPSFQNPPCGARALSGPVTAGKGYFGIGLLKNERGILG